MAQVKKTLLYHPYDRNFYLLLLLLIWAALASGFGFDMLKMNNEGRLHFSLVVHIHIVLYTAWLLIFTIQVLLIRVKNVKLHKTLGLIGVALVPLMAVFGLITALVVAKRDNGLPNGDLNFLCVQFGNVLMFTILAGLGLMRRKQYVEHKRLMMMAAIVLTEPGFSRWLGFKIAPLFGDYFWTYKTLAQGFGRFCVHEILPQLTLLLAMAVYDFYTRKKIPNVMYWGVLFFIAVTSIEGLLYYSSAWHALMKQLIDMI